jgi:hypothetical protein
LCIETFKYVGGAGELVGEVFAEDFALPVAEDLEDVAVETRRLAGVLLTLNLYH